MSIFKKLFGGGKKDAPRHASAAASSSDPKEDLRALMIAVFQTKNDVRSAGIDKNDANRILLHLQDGKNVDFGMSDVHRAVAENPQTPVDELINGYADAVLNQIMGRGPANDPSRDNILPILRDIRSKPVEPGVVSVAVTPNIAVLFVQDLGDLQTTVTHDLLKKLGLSEKGLADMANNNLAMRVGSAIQIIGTPDGLRMVTCGGHYESSLVLNTSLWDQLDADNAGIIAAPMAPDLLVFASDTAAMRDELSTMISTQWDKLDRQVSKSILRRKDGVWSELGLN